MAGGKTPKFCNEAGAREIRIGVKEFECIGAAPPFDHPHVFLDMGRETEIVCPYCSTLYSFDAALKADQSVPAEALYTEPRKLAV
jgi:uncharacterized Zn-finger protein